MQRLGSQKLNLLGLMQTNNNLLCLHNLPHYLSTSRQPIDYAKFFGLSHLKHTLTPDHPKPRSRPTKNQSPPAYHPTPIAPDPELSLELSQESQPTQKNKEPMHQYSSQILPHLAESE